MSYVEPLNKSWCLAKVCEDNYDKLLRLIPDLFGIEFDAIGKAPHRMAIQLRILEKNPYTLTIELNHALEKADEASLLPALKIRVYRDAKSAEVLRDYFRVEVAQHIKDIGESVAILNYKWRLNYFLTKWLDHCLCANYCFKG